MIARCRNRVVLSRLQENRSASEGLVQYAEIPGRGYDRVRVDAGQVNPDDRAALTRECRRKPAGEFRASREAPESQWRFAGFRPLRLQRGERRSVECVAKIDVVPFDRDFLGRVGSDQYPTTGNCCFSVCPEQAATGMILRIGRRADDHYRITACSVEIRRNGHRDQRMRYWRWAAACCYLAKLLRQLDAELARAAGFESSSGCD